MPLCSHVKLRHFVEAQSGELATEGGDALLDMGRLGLDIFRVVKSDVGHKNVPPAFCYSKKLLYSILPRLGKVYYEQWTPNFRRPFCEIEQVTMGKKDRVRKEGKIKRSNGFTSV